MLLQILYPFTHMKQSTKPKIGVLLTNLGTPSAPTPNAVRRYLAEFLWDPRVVEIPRPLWWLILHGIILRTRPHRSAKLYQKIWTDQGSPLLANSHRLAGAVQQQIDLRSEISFKIALGMRYGEPSIADALNNLRQQEIDRLLILPLYPQYSAATTASTFDAVSKTLQTWRRIPEITMISQYHVKPDYIAAIAASIQQQRTQISEPHHLLFSFHGLPQRFVDAGDPYQQQCHATVQKIAEKLQLSKEQWSIAFQSRFGKAQWLQPYCDKTLERLPAEGKKNVAVICPGFAVDCLETLEEIAMQNRDIFLAAGGENFHYIPALNHSAAHVDMLTQLILCNSAVGFR